jgi:ZIP family zinc transporter
MPRHATPRHATPQIPEGVAVALPVYYATGSRWRAFAWSALSGAAEPLGGLIGYAVLSSTGM